MSSQKGVRGVQGVAEVRECDRFSICSLTILPRLDSHSHAELGGYRPRSEDPQLLELQQLLELLPSRSILKLLPI